LRAIAIPLFAGNTVILKGSEYTPASQRILIDIFLLAGLPPTALQFLLFTRETAGELTERLIVHKAVKRVTFTGSDKVGRIVGGICGREIKQCVLELGGKAPAVVLQGEWERFEGGGETDEGVRRCEFGRGGEWDRFWLDAPLWTGAYLALSFVLVLTSSSQICMSTERVIVHSSVHDKLVSLITSRVALLSSGDLHPTGPSTSQLSALFSITAAENVNRMLEAGKKAGLAWAYDGGESQGTVVQPQVILVSPEERTTSELWKEEVFGPGTSSSLPLSLSLIVPFLQ
jgi:acyl-CoA reductase-like NAD-dependent aldehyde dehydrogenase